jgi:HTH-type transcriptional regulator/antitoxin HipB
MKKEIKTSSLSEMKDKYIGKLGSLERDAYENELSMEVLEETIKKNWHKRKLTQD